MKRFGLALITIAMMSGGGFSPAFALDYEEYPSIRLRSLDKVTARTLTFDAQVGSTIKFGDIYIKILTCRKPPAVESNEAASFLQIWQVDKVSLESKWIFSGWMFSSSPALSAMDHAVYDVWVIDCFGKEDAAPPPPAADTDKAAEPLPDEGTVPEESVVKPTETPEEQKAKQDESAKTEGEPSDVGQGTDVPVDSEAETGEVSPPSSTVESPRTDDAPLEPGEPQPSRNTFDGIY